MIISYNAPAVLIQINHTITGKPHIVRLPTPATFVKPTGGNDEYVDFCHTCLQDSTFVNGCCHWCGNR